MEVSHSRNAAALLDSNWRMYDVCTLLSYYMSFRLVAARSDAGVFQAINMSDTCAQLSPPVGCT